MKDASRAKFNFYQVVLVFLSLIFVVLVFESVRRGLVMAPDMRIVGNGSYDNRLFWYQYEAVNRLPQPWILLFPTWVYNWFIMLPWASWLVYSMLGWAKWGWSMFSKDQIWKAKSEVVKP